MSRAVIVYSRGLLQTEVGRGQKFDYKEIEDREGPKFQCKPSDGVGGGQNSSALTSEGSSKAPRNYTLIIFQQIIFHTIQLLFPTYGM